MFGLKYSSGKFIFTAAVKTEALYLNLYRGNKRVKQIPFDPEKRIGDVWSLEITEDIRAYSYAYEADGHVFTDPNGIVFYGRKKFGNLKDGTGILKTPVGEAVEIPADSDAWKQDRPLDIPYHDSIVYRLHVRGFTEHKSSRLKPDVRGTFRGIMEKIPYLKSLGITAVELMPPYEFNEVMLPHFGSGDPHEPELKPTGKINYWGFTSDAMHLAPKRAYTSDDQNPRNEFRRLVLALHQNGIEIVVDLYFTEETLPDYINTVMRYWRVQYHIDGIHLIGNAPCSVVARDPYLSRFKIWADSWEGCQTEECQHTGAGAKETRQRYLAEYNDGFRNDMRRVLKGDESMLRTLMDRIRENPENHASIQYMANVSGMTMTDMVSYDRKHNELNGERNMDGMDTDYSWNCGEEGPSRKKYVKLLRKKMLRNAFVLLLLSQGTPLILAGDEFGHSQKGNNNPYCQDNEINWLDWGLLEKNRDLYAFAQYMIAFRRKHGVFHQPKELRNLDYKSVGIPDISFHGENAWQPDLENFRRQLGVMYAGDYAGDDCFLVLYNFHWEKHLFKMAHPPVGKKWAVAIDTAAEELNGIYPEGREMAVETQEKIVEARSIVVLRAVPDQNYKPKKKRTIKSGRTES